LPRAIQPGNAEPRWTQLRPWGSNTLAGLPFRQRGESDRCYRAQGSRTLPTVNPKTTLTRLRRDTAREMQVLKSSGFFLHRQVMRLTAAVTTPCSGRWRAHQSPGDGQTGPEPRLGHGGRAEAQERGRDRLGYAQVSL
jgi:hypothetical protein